MKELPDDIGPRQFSIAPRALFDIPNIKKGSRFRETLNENTILLTGSYFNPNSINSPNLRYLAYRAWYLVAFSAIGK